MRAGFLGRPARSLSPAALLALLVACQAGGLPWSDPGPPGDTPDPPAKRAPPGPGTALALAEPTAMPGRPFASAGTAGEARPHTASSTPGDDHGCLAVLARLRAATEAGSVASDPPSIAVLLTERDRPTRFGAHGLRIDADLPLPVHRGDGGEIAAPCLLIVAEPEEPARVERRVTGPERVASDYVSDVVREANPAYEAAKIRARQAEKRLGGRRDVGAVRTGDPLLDLIGTAVGGLLGSLGARHAEQEFEEAVAALKDTPTRRERPVYRPYTYERWTVHASKRTAVPVTLIDRERDLVWSARVRSDEERAVHLFEGRHASDRDAAVHGGDGDRRRELELWERAAPEVQLSALIERFLAAAPPARSAGDVGAAIARLGSAAVGAAGGPAVATTPVPMEHARRSSTSGTARAPSPADPRSRSVVRITGRNGAGSGFYVAPELVLTSDHVTAGASVVDVSVADGATVPGLVARRDPRRGLALIKVPKPGPPLALHAGAALEPGSPVAALSYPQGPDLGLSRGVIGAVRHVPSPRAAGLEDVLVVETDATLDAGGPLLQGQRVVGVNGWDRIGHGGPTVTLHYREVLAFLTEFGL